MRQIHNNQTPRPPRPLTTNPHTISPHTIRSKYIEVIDAYIDTSIWKEARETPLRGKGAGHVALLVLEGINESERADILHKAVRGISALVVLVLVGIA